MKDPDYSIRDLYNSIAGGYYPSYTLWVWDTTLNIVFNQQITNFLFKSIDWKILILCDTFRYVQVMTFYEAKNWNFNPFDVTKVWPHNEFPLREVGKLVLNRNPKNYFAEVEQIAFSPSHLVPGIEPSPDKMLQVVSNC